MTIEKDELLSVIPHRGKMMLLTRVNDYNPEENSIEAEYHVTKDCLFYDSSVEGVPSWVGFEFMAQAVSAFIGIRDRNKKSHKSGYILTVSQMRLGLPFFQNGSIITIKSWEVEGVDPVYVFHGEIFLDGKKVIEGKITVMDVQDEQGNNSNKR